MASSRIPSDSTVGSGSHGDSMDTDFSPPSSRRSSVTNVSVHEEGYEDLQTTLTQLQGSLSNLRIQAQVQLNLQPKRTQVALTNQTRAIFKSYATHGSQARLSQSILSYLSDRNNTKDLTIWNPTEAAAAAQKADERISLLRVLSAHRAFSIAKEEALAQGKDPNLIDPTKIPGADINNSPLDGRKTLLNDPEALEYLKSQDFSPADIELAFDEEVDVPPEILTTTNKIVHLLNMQAQAHLHHHVTKYITMSDHPTKVENGYVVLRAGLHEYYTQLVTNLFATSQSNNDGFEFTQAQRSWLRECYEHMGVGLEGGRNGEMTERERLLIARAVGVEEDAVEDWWEYMARNSRARKAMRVWIKARELEWVRKAKMEDRF